MKKLILTLVLAVCSFQMGYTQELDAKTIDKIMVLLYKAEASYDLGDYYESVNKIHTIEELSGELRSIKVQLLKMKTYVGLKNKYGEFSQESLYNKVYLAQLALDELYKMSPNDSIRKEIAPYSVEIDNFLSRLTIANRQYNIKHFQETKVYYPFIEFAADLTGEGWALINEKGEYVLGPHQYEGKRILNMSDGVSGVLGGNGKWGFVDINGDIVIPYEYEFASNFTEGLGIVKINSKYGFIDKKGTLIIPSIYDDVRNFSESLARVKLNGKYGFIDKKGSVVIPLKYDFSREYFKNGLVKVGINDEYNYINTNGERVD